MSSGLFYHNSLDWSISSPVVNANSVNPDLTQHSRVSDLDLHCLPITVLEVSRLKRLKQTDKSKQTVSD